MHGAYVPEPVEVHRRRVDTEGYVCLHTNRYSVPEERIGQHLEVHETLDRIRVYEGHQLVTEHVRQPEGAGVRVTLPEHRRRRARREGDRPPPPEEITLRAAGPALAALCEALRKDRSRGRRAVVRLHRLWLDYPTEVVESAVARALDFGVANVEQIERIVLQSLRDQYFRLHLEDQDG
jgi:hypothetical protein